MTVAPATATVKVGATVALAKTVTPSNAEDQSGTWTSSNASFATVDANGVVKGIAAGIVTITFTSKDGAYTAVSKITVTA